VETIASFGCVVGPDTMWELTEKKLTSNQRKLVALYSEKERMKGGWV